MARLEQASPKPTTAVIASTLPTGETVSTTDLRKLDLVAVMAEAGYDPRDLGHGKFAVTCPWASEHSSTPAANDTSTVIFTSDGKKPPAFHCSHGHCEGRKLSDVLESLPREMVERHFKDDQHRRKTSLESANEFLENRGYLDASTGSLRLRHHQDTWFTFDGKVYREISDDDLFAQLVEHFCADEGSAAQLPGIASSVRSLLRGICHVEDSCERPLWLGASAESINAEEIIVVQNGLVRLSDLFSGKTGVFSPHRPDFFTTVCLPYENVDNAQCPRWLAFLEEVLPDPEARAFLQEWFGYQLLVDTRQSTFVLLVGEGANGKSVVANILVELVGRQNCASVGLERFGQRFALSSTYGKLANVAAEIGEIDKAAEGLLKAFVSGDFITFERKFKDPFLAKPTARLTFATNNAPRFVDRSLGMWRRMVCIEFPVTIPPERQDRELTAKLTAELPGIFHWAVEGLKRMRARGRFVEPKSSETYKATYRDESNPARAFLQEEVHEEPGARIPVPELYAHYRDYCHRSGYQSLGQAQFGKEVRRIYPAVKKEQRREGGKRISVYVGITVDDLTSVPIFVKTVRPALLLGDA